ncbi:histidine-phosphotransfer domain, HPT domain-containing protein [Trametopsis cervina]|nr:histidine-phosphotransfer domain, HPT domain-containing protein [Trametopsis cervina]
MSRLSVPPPSRAAVILDGPPTPTNTTAPSSSSIISSTPTPTTPSKPKAPAAAPSVPSTNGKSAHDPPTKPAAPPAKIRSPSPELVEIAEVKPAVIAPAVTAPPTPAAAPAAEEPAESDLPVVDMDTFEQILELDEDDEREFSLEMVWQYFEQAEEAFTNMDHQLQSKSLSALSSLGHYLKGSSAALGVARVQATCEKIQHYGQCWDEENKARLGEDAALDKIAGCLVQVQEEYKQAKAWLKAWYREKGIVKD